MVDMFGMPITSMNVPLVRRDKIFDPERNTIVYRMCINFEVTLDMMDFTTYQEDDAVFKYMQVELYKHIKDFLIGSMP